MDEMRGTVTDWRDTFAFTQNNVMKGGVVQGRGKRGYDKTKTAEGNKT
jgi:hypothetical protein